MIRTVRTLFQVVSPLWIGFALILPWEAVAQDVPKETPWKMHHIDRQFYNHNSLSPGDVDGDGFTDYCVIHEGDDVVTILFHPGKSGDVRAPWRKVVVGKTSNVEYGWLADLNGDGRLDVVTCGGGDGKKPPSMRVIWGPPQKDCHDGSAWIDGGEFPMTVNRGHFLFTETADLNGDGAMDIIGGGRVSARETTKNLEGKPRAGLFWLEAPKDRSLRRDLSKWSLHYIDPQTPGAYGFVQVDVDGDGDLDIAVCNVDWNTRDEDQEVVWYENPGTGSPEQRQPWKKHVIYHGNGEFYSKAQLAAGDLDGDGRVDFCIQTKTNVLVFKQVGRNPVAWKTIPVPKPPHTCFIARPTKMIDLNGDGRLDIVGMLIHDEKGSLPADKASVFWMENQGDPFRPENWITNVIKWSDGVNTGKVWQGEKWDNIRFADVDGDGRSDILGNCEEYYTVKNGEKTTQLGVVWFENPGK